MSKQNVPEYEEPDIDQVFCQHCGGMKKLIINGKTIPEKQWQKEMMKYDYFLANDIGCCC